MKVVRAYNYKACRWALLYTQGHYMASVSLPQSHVGNITYGEAEITTSTRKDTQRHHFDQFAEEQDDVSPVLRLAIAQRRDE